MESIAEQLVGQVLGEKQVYLDNARLKHGVPRHDQPVVIQPGCAPQQSVVDSVRNQTVQPVAKKSSLLKTAAIVAMSAAAGAFGIPPIVTAFAGKAIVEKIAPSDEQSDGKPEEFNDLVNWLRQKGLDRGTE